VEFYLHFSKDLHGMDNFNYYKYQSPQSYAASISNHKYITGSGRSVHILEPIKCQERNTGIQDLIKYSRGELMIKRICALKCVNDGNISDFTIRLFLIFGASHAIY
jgi:hypothetical protein